MTASIDASGRGQIATMCDNSILYSTSSADGTWSTTAIYPPMHRFEENPQLAVVGDLVYLAYSRVTPEDGCGAQPTDVGVYFRWRRAPDGDWSKPIRLGRLGDGIQSFRVVGRTVHATVKHDPDGHVYYETLHGNVYHRYRLPGATGQTSLQVGRDGRARIAYEASGTLRYAVLTASGLRTSTIAGSKDGWRPVLTLDAQEHPHLLWTLSPHSQGCAAPGPTPQDGTYYATLVGGQWTSERVSKAVGESAILVDDVTRRVEVLVGFEPGLVRYTKRPNGSWGETTLSFDWIASPALLRDPATHALDVFYRDTRRGQDGIYELTKP